MTPVATGVTPTRRTGGVQAEWTPEKIVRAIRRWVELYGEPPRAADWNPSSARWSRQTWRIARYRQGDPETGESWPSLNTAKHPFGGSLNAAVRAAGFEPAKSGPHRQGSVLPEDVEGIAAPPAVRAALRDAASRATTAERLVKAQESQLARAQVQVQALRDAARDARSQAPLEAAPVITRERIVERRVPEPAAIKRVEARAAKTLERATTARDSTQAALSDAKSEVARARRDATRLAARLERAEATINSLREERRITRHKLAAAAEKHATTERLLETTRADTATVKLAAASQPVRIVHEPSPEAKIVRAAEREAAMARLAAQSAERRADGADRAYAEIASAATGQRRHLTRAELAELRSDGPAGPALFADAIKALAAARKHNDRQALRGALLAAASAAMAWQDRL